ncbi:hypothetical protein FP744_10004293 [Trichoderma asperellum]|nr:hypothetical protein LI328DRAFT_171529 [Trichoderma asperelloides]
MEDTSIAKSVRGCLDLFQALTLLPSPLFNNSHKTALMAITEEETRFKVWSGNMGAQASGRRSLQFRLRDASHLQKQVLALLADLSGLLEDALGILRGSKVPWDQIEDDEISDDEPDPLEADGEDGEFPTTELEQIASIVPDTVNCLLRLSVAIRNPAPHDCFAASIPIDVSNYEFFDIQHVQAKFPKIDSLLAQRLGNTISRRRQYFIYRESHHLKLAHGLDFNELKDQADGKSTLASSIPDYTKSAGIDNTLSAIDEDAVSDAGISQTSFASFPASTERLRIPPLPKGAENGPFECPFCYMIITATNRASWKRHVFSDLKPYICLSEDCKATEKWFARRHEWILHEIQSHWKLYACPYSCSEVFQSRSKCVEHVQKSHSISIPEHQLEAMINLNSRPIKSENGVLCPMCKESLDTVERYQRHVGRHQEQLALFALPSTQSRDTEDEHDNDKRIPHRNDLDNDSIDTADGGVYLEKISVDDEHPTRARYPDISNRDLESYDSDSKRQGTDERGMDRNNLIQSEQLYSQYRSDKEDTLYQLDDARRSLLNRQALPHRLRASTYGPGPHESFSGVDFEEDHRYFDALRYQEDVSGGTPMPLTAELLRKASKRRDSNSSRSTRSSGSYDKSDYKQSNTTGHTIPSSAAHDDFIIKLSGAAVVKMPGAQIHYDGGEITFSSGRDRALDSRPPGASLASSNKESVTYQLDDEQSSHMERKAPHAPHAHIPFEPYDSERITHEHAPYDPSLAAHDY